MDSSGTATGFDDDIDDIMASIMQSKVSQPADPYTYTQEFPRPKKLRPKSTHLDLASSKTPVKKKKSDFLDLSQPSIKSPASKQRTGQQTRRPIGISSEATFNLPPKYYQPEAEERYYNQVTDDTSSGSNLLKVSAISFGVLVVTLIGGIFLWHGPISDALKPKTPFSPEVSQKMGLPLYFPTKLPGSYKMETNSIAQPDPSAIVYVVSDNENHKLNISLQKQPGDIDLSSVYAKMTNLKEINTKFGNVKVGTMDEKVDIANILTGQTWVIITSDKGTISSDSLKVVIDNLEF